MEVKDLLTQWRTWSNKHSRVIRTSVITAYIKTLAFLVMVWVGALLGNTSYQQYISKFGNGVVGVGGATSKSNRLYIRQRRGLHQPLSLRMLWPSANVPGRVIGTYRSAIARCA